MQADAQTESALQLLRPSVTISSLESSLRAIRSGGTRIVGEAKGLFQSLGCHRPYTVAEPCWAQGSQGASGKSGIPTTSKAGFDNAMNGTVIRSKDGVSGWGGEPGAWSEYRAAARLYVASTKYELRYTCGPRLAAEVTGAARTAIQGQGASWLGGHNGAEVLLRHLQTTIAEDASVLQSASPTQRRITDILLRTTS